MEQLPGLKVHINDGRIAGTFDLPPADMEQISYGGRVMLVLIADTTNIKVGDTKEGDTKATWTFTVADSGIVRDPEMQQHLADVLFLHMQDTIPGLEDALRSFQIPAHLLDGTRRQNRLPEGASSAPAETFSGGLNDDYEPIDEELLAEQQVALDALDELLDHDFEDLPTSEPAEVEQIEVLSAPPARKDQALKQFLEDGETRKERQREERTSVNHLKDFFEEAV